MCYDQLNQVVEFQQENGQTASHPKDIFEVAFQENIEIEYINQHW